MEGVVASTTEKAFTAVLANFHHLTGKLTKTDKVGRLHLDSSMTAKPIDKCLAIKDNKPRLVKTKEYRHVDKIPFDHILFSNECTQAWSKLYCFIDKRSLRYAHTNL